jgi:hypothetical protein
MQIGIREAIEVNTIVKILNAVVCVSSFTEQGQYIDTQVSSVPHLFSEVHVSLVPHPVHLSDVNFLFPPTSGLIFKTFIYCATFYCIVLLGLKITVLCPPPEL